MERGHPDIALGAAAGAVLSRGDGTRERILDAALAVLREVGHGHFSVQKVARAAGVYQGNITYYWPRRRDLVRALAVRVIDDYRRAFHRRFDADGVTLEERATLFVRWMVEDAISTDRVLLLPELWSMANADPEIAQDVTRCADEVTEALMEGLGVTDGQPCAPAVRRAMRLAGIAAQGLTAVHGRRAPDDAVLHELREDLVAVHSSRIAAALRSCADRPER